MIDTMINQKPCRARVAAPFFMLLLLTGLTACSNRDDHDHPDLTTGEQLFNHHCAECHGKDGTGMLEKRTPANILTRKSRDGIVNYITTDVNPQRKMPVFKNMPNAEAVAIANHLLKLRQKYQQTPYNQKKPQELMIKP
jgi:mono/diheme cytochrome c family protein